MDPGEGYCEQKTFVVPYLEYAVFIPIFLVLQLLLLIYTIHKEYKKEKYLQDVSIVVRFSFIALQLSGIYWSIIDLLRFVIDPQQGLMQNNEALCSIVAYSPKIIVIIYYGVYLHQIFYRLDVSFKHSALELSKTSKVSLSCLLYIPMTAIPVTFFIFSSKRCIWVWSPVDFPQWKHMAFCDVPITGIGGLIITTGILWVCIANLIFGAVFAHKLRTMLSARQRRGSGHSATSIHTFKLKSVMIKNTILVCFASLSTLVNWIGWWTLAAPNGLGATLLYFDIFINMMLVSLMFRYNETYYKKLCSCCIKKCFEDCDKAYNQKSEDKIRYQLELYFKNADLNKVMDRPYHSSSPATKKPKLHIAGNSIYLTKVDSNSVANSNSSSNYSSEYPQSVGLEMAKKSTDFASNSARNSITAKSPSNQITPAPTPKATPANSMEFPPLSAIDKSDTPSSMNPIDKKTK
mmetsp:Transcript_14678/g.13178  ORF Transcript_14678/g.13178 Transcript_14678/m.13178 type:complete len:462 (-) Transcript_14678:219-1604(-)